MVFGNSTSDYRRHYAQTPIFSFNNAAILTTASEVFSFEDRDSTCQKYLPFHELTVTNFSGQAIRVKLNQAGTGLIIPDGTIQVFDRRSVPALSSLTVTNIGTGTCAATTVQIDVQNTAYDSNDLTMSLHRFISGV